LIPLQVFSPFLSQAGWYEYDCIFCMGNEHQKYHRLYAASEEGGNSWEEVGFLCAWFSGDRKQETEDRFSVNLFVTDALIRDLLGIGRGVSYELSDP